MSHNVALLLDNGPKTVRSAPVSAPIKPFFPGFANHYLDGIYIANMRLKTIGIFKRAAGESQCLSLIFWQCH